MTRFPRILSASLIGAAALLAAPLAGLAPADAASVRMCGAQRAGVASGPSRFTASSGTVYSVDARGCALVAPTDLGDFRAAGYIPQSSCSQVATTSFDSTPHNLTVPAAAVITSVVAQSSTPARQHVKIGTTSGAADVVNELIVYSGGINDTSPASLVKRSFSSTAPQTLFLDLLNAGLFQGAGPKVTIFYCQF